jgi:hypothetical protein
MRWEQNQGALVAWCSVKGRVLSMTDDWSVGLGSRATDWKSVVREIVDANFDARRPISDLLGK